MIKKTLKYTAIFIAIFLLSIICVWIVETMVNLPFKTIADEKTWIGFYGSILGGIIGGIGTLLAVYFTTKETRLIQRKTDNNISIIEKRRFTNDIAQVISEYITDISAFYYARTTLESTYSEQEIFKEQLSQISDEIDASYAELISPYYYEDKIGKMEYLDSKERFDMELEGLKEKRENLLNRININDNYINRISHQRTSSIRCYYLLNIKLKNLDIAKDLINHICYIHNFSTIPNLTNDIFNTEIEKLISKLTIFVDCYLVT